MMTTEELVAELARREGTTLVYIPSNQAYNIKRCVADDVSIQWFRATEGNGKVNILVVKEG